MDTSLALKRLGVIVKNTRATIGFNQRQFAKLFGTSHPSISNLENGRYINLPDHSTLIRLAQIIKVPYWQLIKSLEEGNELIFPESLSVEEVIAGISSLDSVEDCLDILYYLSEKIQRLREN